MRQASVRNTIEGNAMSPSDPVELGPTAPPPEVTALLLAWRAGEVAAGEELMHVLYGELNEMATGA